MFSCPNRALTSSSCPSSSSCCCYCTALISGTIAVWRATTSTTSSCPDASLPPSDPRPAASLQQRGMHTSLNTAAKKAYLNQPNLCVYASVVTWSTTSWKNFLGALKSFFSHSEGLQVSTTFTETVLCCAVVVKTHLQNTLWRKKKTSVFQIRINDQNA